MSSESKVYTGSCHCGKNSFSVKVSPPLDSEKSSVISCNCSICSRNGYLLVFLDLSDIDWKKGGFDNMKVYKFGHQTLSHYFCPECGGTFAVHGTMGGVEKVGMNVRIPIYTCLPLLIDSEVRFFDGVDLSKLKIAPYNGKDL
jgi:hypothetical protein